MSEKAFGFEFVFENCECLEISANDVGYCCLSDIQEKIERWAVNAIVKSKIVNNVEFTLKRSADVPYVPPYDSFCNQQSTFDRIMRHSDITQIKVKYEGGNSELFYPVWSNIDEYRNYYQETILHSNGELEIRINQCLLTGACNV